MPIQVTCPGCLKRFSVADKFAGKKGPCPKCKQIITIPKKEDEVIIHAPDHSEAGAVDASGRQRSQDVQAQGHEVSAAVVHGRDWLGAGCTAHRARDSQLRRRRKCGSKRWPPSCLARRWPGPATHFLRDPELEAYQGSSADHSLARLRTCVRAAVGSLLVLGRSIFRPRRDEKGPGNLADDRAGDPVFAAGTLAAYASFDLDPGSAFFHCAMYFAVTVLLRLVADLPAVPGLGGS